MLFMTDGFDNATLASVWWEEQVYAAAVCGIAT
jgi:hypothetical protein